MPTITPQQFRRIADDRMEDCQALLAAGRYDAVMYLSGYVLEAALKACICDTLGWDGFPTPKEDGYRFVRLMMVHDLGLLLHYSGRRSLVTSQLASEWERVVSDWDVGMRYNPDLNTGREMAEQRMIDIAEIRRAL